MKKFLKSLIKRADKKAKEYTPGKDRAENFKNAVGISLHDTPEKVAWEYCVKHLESIRSIIKDKRKVSPELIDEKIGDIIIYMLLIRSMLLDQQQSNEQS